MCVDVHYRNMARPVSAIEGHPQRHKIIEALLAGQTLKQIAAWTEPAVSTAAICRWRRNAIAPANQALSAIAPNNDIHAIPTAAHVDHQAVTRVALLNAADPFLTAVAHQTTRRARWMRDIEDAGDYSDNGPDYKTLAVLDRNDQSGLELHARLAGRLDAPAQNQTNIMIVCPASHTEAVQEPDVVTIDIGPRK